MDLLRKDRKVKQAKFTKMADTLEELLLNSSADLQLVITQWDMLKDKYYEILALDASIYGELLNKDVDEWELSEEIDLSDIFRLRFFQLRAQYNKYRNSPTVSPAKSQTPGRNEVEGQNESLTCWYRICTKVNPPLDDQYVPETWDMICPSPYFPTYRRVTRIVALILIGLISWNVLYIMAGDSLVPPRGLIYQLTLLSVCSQLGGWLFSLSTCPALVGMMVTGFTLQNVGIINMDASFIRINAYISQIALAIILTRAGLDMDRSILRKMKFTILKLAVVPWSVECLLSMTLAYLLLDLPWKYGLILGSILAAVAPAVVVPCLFKLRSNGYGVVKGIPTLAIAVASIDGALSMAIFGTIIGIIFVGAGIEIIIAGLLSLVLGVAVGILWGIICSITPERKDPFIGTLRILLIFTGGVGGIMCSDFLGYGGVGPLMCITSAFVAVGFWMHFGWEHTENPVSLAFEIFWIIIQPIVFGITGAKIKLNELKAENLLMCIVIIVLSVVTRMFVTVMIAFGSNLNWKEKIFLSITWICKGIIQVALGSVALAHLLLESSHHEEHAEIIMECCVLSIIFTAPTGAMLTSLLGPRLLVKNDPPVLKPKIRRPSLIDD